MFETKDRKDFLPWSITKLSSFGCGRWVRHLFENNAQFDGKMNDMHASNLTEGIAMHELLDGWFHENMPNQSPSQKPTPSIGQVLSRWRIHPDQWVPCFEQFEKAKRFFAFDPKSKAPLFYGGDIVGVERALAVDEQWLPCERDDLEKVFCKGTLDLIQLQGGVVTVTDHKRQWNMLSESEMGAKLQMQLYASLAFAHYPHAHKVVVRMYFIRYGTTQEVSFFPEDVAMIPSVVREMGDAMIESLRLNGDAPIPSEQCALCSLVSTCNAVKVAEGAPALVVNEMDARALSKKLHWMKRWVSDATAHLKVWSMHHGPVETNNGKQIGFVPSENPSWETINKESFWMTVDALEREGVLKDISFHPNDLVEINGKALRKFVEALESHAKKTGKRESYEAVLSLVTPRHRTVFREHKKKA